MQLSMSLNWELRSRTKPDLGASGCPWIIRARIQLDNSVRVQINRYSHQCASRSRVLGTMAYQAWIAERTIPLLKKKPGIGSKEVQTILQDKYKIEINYQTVWYGRQRAADKLFDRNQWPEVDKGFKLYPPLGKKRVVGRQRKNRIPSCLERSGKAIRQVKCDGCGEKGHRRGSWKCHLTGKKRGRVPRRKLLRLAERRPRWTPLLNMMHQKRQQHQGLEQLLPGRKHKLQPGKQKQHKQLPGTQLK